MKSNGYNTHTHFIEIYFQSLLSYRRSVYKIKLTVQLLVHLNTRWAGACKLREVGGGRVQGVSRCTPCGVPRPRLNY